METWKDEIARRWREREERELLIERVLNKVDGVLNDLIKELKSEYGIKTEVKLKHSSHGEPYWIVKIENTSVEINSSLISKYFNEKAEIKDALIELMLDNFKFND